MYFPVKVLLPEEGRNKEEEEGNNWCNTFSHKTASTDQISTNFFFIPHDIDPRNHLEASAKWFDPSLCVKLPFLRIAHCMLMPNKL